MPFHTELKSADELRNILLENNSWVILKFTATWCGPCKKAENFINPWLHTLSEKNVSIYILDIDVNFEIYGYLKKKRRLNGIPSILAYKAGNHEIIPDLFISGSNQNEINTFFERISTA